MKSDGAPVTENESSENRDEENELSDVRNEPEMNEYFSLDTQLQSGEPNYTQKSTIQYTKIAIIPIEEIERFALRTFSAQLPEPD